MLKTLGRETKGFRLVSVLTPIFMIAEVIMEMIIPKLMASIIDNGVTPGNMQVIYTVGAQMVVAALFGLLFGILGAVAGSHAATGFARNLRRGMFRNIQTFSFANIDKYSTAGLVTRMTTDVTNIQNAYQMLLRMSVRAPASMIVALIMSYTINRRLANIYLIAVILLGCALAFIMSRATKYFGEAFRKYDDLNESVQENVSAIRVVKAYVREKFESEKFRKASENVRNLLMRAELIIAWNAPFMQLTVYSCILLISWMGARLIVNSGATTFTTGDILIFQLNICNAVNMTGKQHNRSTIHFRLVVHDFSITRCCHYLARVARCCRLEINFKNRIYRSIISCFRSIEVISKHLGFAIFIRCRPR